MKEHEIFYMVMYIIAKEYHVKGFRVIDYYPNKLTFEFTVIVDNIRVDQEIQNIEKEIEKLTNKKAEVITIYGEKEGEYTLEIDVYL